VVNAIRPTLGPLPHLVACEGVIRNHGAELLDDGGVIARRIIQLVEPGANMGAMYVRHLLWQLHQRVGDGTATAAAMFQRIYNDGLRYLAVGGNAMTLRRGLACQAVRVQGKEKLAQVAQAVAHDEPLAKMLGEIFDIIGEYGRLDIRAGRSRTLEREYAEGMYWDGGLLSRHMLTGSAQTRIELENAAVLISDLAADEPGDLLPLLDLAAQNGLDALVLVMTSISEQAIGFLLDDKVRRKIQVVPVKIPGAGRC
jgi:chaperonin GroEL